MSNTSRKLKKKKDREKRVKTKIIDRRMKIREGEKEIKELQKSIKEDESLKEQLRQMDEMLDKLPKDVMDKVMHNIEIIKALEEGYEQDIKVRDKINSDLEEEGYVDIKDKIEVLQERAAKESKEYVEKHNKNPDMGIAGSSTCSMEENKSN